MPLSSPARFGRIKAHPPHAAPGQAIGLLGGSFNPPHAAHRMISEVALKRLGLDKVWWVVSPGNPLKRRGDTAPLPQRLVQCREVARNPHIVVTDFEADLPTPYTASTLAFLRMRNPLVRYVWIMGADNLAGFDRWQRWREIFTMVPIVVVDRPGWRLKALASKAARAFAAARLAHRPAPAWTFLTGPLSRASSTALRSTGRRSNEPVANKTQAMRALPPKKRPRGVSQGS
jgi:nicotinate-nucleotide adenylyltransferase